MLGKKPSNFFGKSVFEAFYSLWLPAFLLINIPLLSKFLENKHDVYLEDLGISIFLNCLTITIVVLSYYFLWRKNKFAGFIAVVFVTFLLGNTYIDRYNQALPLLKSFSPIPRIEPENENLVFSLIYLVIIYFLGFLLGNLVTKLTNKFKLSSQKIIQALTVSIVVIFLFQFIPIVSFLIGSWDQLTYQPPKKPLKLTQTANGRPDIYYIILDRYTNQEVLKNQLNFDNSSFTRFLEEKGYYIKPDAYSSYPFTTMSVSSTLNLDYHNELVEKFKNTDTQSRVPFHNQIRSANAIKDLKSIGYSYHLIGSIYQTTNYSPLADITHTTGNDLTIFGKQTSINRFANSELLSGVFSTFVKSELFGSNRIIAYKDNTDYNSKIKSQLDTLRNLSREKSGQRFILAHLLIPHDPYGFLANGAKSANSVPDDYGSPRGQKYLGQIQYINNEIGKILDEIHKNSQNQSVVILQADEGPYPDHVFSALENYSTADQTIWSTDLLKTKLGTLAAYYIPKADKAALAQNINSVNVFRIVFNTYFGTKLPYLPECHYAYKFAYEKIYQFTDVTEKISQKPSPDCAKI